MGSCRWRVASLVLILAVLTLSAATPTVLPSRAHAATEAAVLQWQHGQKPDEPPLHEGIGRRAEFVLYDSLPMEVGAWAVRATSTSDPAGILVMAKRSVRASSDYHGHLRFTRGRSDQRAAALHVGDGDQVTISHHMPTEVTRLSATWSARSARPQWLDVALSNADPAVLGGRMAVAARAQVRAYSSANAEFGSALAVGVSDGEGSFRLPLPAASARVWLSAVETGAPESARIAVALAQVTGIVSLPEPGRPPGDTALVGFQRDGCPPGDACNPGGPVSGRGGRFAATSDTSHGWVGGDYRLTTTLQGVGRERTATEWLSSAYGNPDPVTFHKTEGRTADVGELVAKAPNVLGSVRDDLGLAVPEAQLDLLGPSGEHLGGGGYARHDGQFALFLADGDHRLRLRPTIGCYSLDEAMVSIRVRNGVADPARVDVVLRRGPRHDRQLTLPLPADGRAAGIVLHASAQPVELLLDGSGGGSSVTVSCSGAGATPPPGITLVDPGVELDPGDLHFRAARVCLGYDDVAVARAGLQEAQLEVLHFDHQSSPPEVQTVSRDPAANVVCGVTSSFSSFALGRVDGAAASDVPPAPPASVSTSASSPPTAAPTEPRSTASRTAGRRAADMEPAPADTTTSQPVDALALDVADQRWSPSGGVGDAARGPAAKADQGAPGRQAAGPMALAAAVVLVVNVVVLVRRRAEWLPRR